MRFSLLITLSRKYRLRDYQFRLVGCVVALTIIGILVIGSANESYRQKQILGLILGLLVMTVVSVWDYNYFLQFYWLIYAINIGFLLMVKIFGDSSGGSQRWIDFGFIRFQPSELTKILMILFLAEYLTHHKDDLSRLKTIIQTLALIAVPVLFIVKQPDMSTSIVVLAVCMTLYFLAGLSAKIVGGALAIGIPSFAIFFYLATRTDQTLISNYQFLRIMAWLYPEEYPQSAYQQQNSITAVGSGCLLGKGLYNTDVSSVKNGNFISEPQTDFIFAVLGEELGFVGTCAVIVLLFLISILCIYTGYKASNMQGKLIGYGIGSLISIQSFFNICVVTGLLPNTGLPLPFVSYGLTSLVSLFLGIGFVLNVGLQRAKY